jgi:hypothetical protein
MKEDEIGKVRDGFLEAAKYNKNEQLKYERVIFCETNV